MKIHFIGLSSFLIENQAGFRILVDPFNDAPEWQLGAHFPKTFRDQPFGANIVLSSEPDADHSCSPGDWLAHAPATQPNSNPFPNLDLRGTVIYEYSGDVNIAWHYTVDGIRLAHFADNAHELTDEQLSKLGTPDIIFISPPKTADREANEIVRKNIERLKPKLIFWSHHLAPANLPTSNDTQLLRSFFVEYFRQHAHTSKQYEDDTSFMELCYLLENALVLNAEYAGVTLLDATVEVDNTLLKQGETSPVSFLFRSMTASSSPDMSHS